MTTPPSTVPGICTPDSQAPPHVPLAGPFPRAGAAHASEVLYGTTLPAVRLPGSGTGAASSMARTTPAGDRPDTAPDSREAGRRLHRPVLDVVIPVYNEEADLERSVRRLHRHLSRQLPYSFRITVADNASTDQTWPIARRLTVELPHVEAVHLSARGRGRALRQVWSSSDAEVLAYMDVDLSTDLAALLPLVAALVSGHSDIAIGTRLVNGSRVVRGPKRELISRSYNLILRTTLGAGFSDAQCGFKAIRADVAARLLPLVEDSEWFFDTELLVLAERAGLRIHEVPVDWVDDPGSTVHIVDTARKDLAGIWRLARGLTTGRIPVQVLARPDDAEYASQVPAGMVGQMGRFAVIGIASTLSYAVLFLILRAGMSAGWANATALLLTAIANTAANRWFTFGVRGPAGRLRHQMQGLVVFAIGLAVTTGALLVLARIAPDAARVFEVTVLTTANVVSTLLRFLLFRAWVFPGARARRDKAPLGPATARPQEPLLGAGMGDPAGAQGVGTQTSPVGHDIRTSERTAS